MLGYINLQRHPLCLGTLFNVYVNLPLKIVLLVQLKVTFHISYSTFQLISVMFAFFTHYARLVALRIPCPVTSEVLVACGVCSSSGVNVFPMYPYTPGRLDRISLLLHRLPELQLLLFNWAGQFGQSGHQ